MGTWGQTSSKTSSTARAAKWTSEDITMWITSRQTSSCSLPRRTTTSSRNSRDNQFLFLFCNFVFVRNFVLEVLSTPLKGKLACCCGASVSAEGDDKFFKIIPLDVGRTVFLGGFHFWPDKIDSVAGLK